VISTSTLPEPRPTFQSKDDRPVVKLVPVAALKALPLFGSAKGLITIADNFDAPLEDFDEYM
jgi:antitoxin (DNA-binding transcriptional repressor) of toxin-antitoxin stability system